MIDAHGLKVEFGDGRGAAAELYWAAVAVLGEAGEVEVGVMRRGAKNYAQHYANDWGQDSTRDRFWLLKLKEGPLCDSSTTDDSAEWVPRVRVLTPKVGCSQSTSMSCGAVSALSAQTRWHSLKRRSIARMPSLRVLYVDRGTSFPIAKA